MTLKVVIHMGGAKTASTTLQTAVMAKSPHVHHFGEIGDGLTTIDEERILHELLNEDEALIDFRGIEGLFAYHRQLAGDRTLVFSSADVLLANRPTVVAARLLDLLGSEVEILLIVRNQLSALESLYSGHGAWLKPAPKPYFRKFVSFHDWLEFQWLRPASSALASFAYWEQIQPFIQAFGIKRMHLVPFELLVKGDMGAWSTVGGLLGLDSKLAWQNFSSDRQRERISMWQKRYGQIATFIRPFASAPDVRVTEGRVTGALTRGRRFTPNWPEGMDNRVRDFYAKGNGCLDESFDLGLRNLGYSLDSGI